MVLTPAHIVPLQAFIPSGARGALLFVPWAARALRPMAMKRVGSAVVAARAVRRPGAEGAGGGLPCGLIPAAAA